jgi:hypothetical protein
MFRCSYCELEVKSFEEFRVERLQGGHCVVTTKDRRRAHDFVKVREWGEADGQGPEIEMGEQESIAGVEEGNCEVVPEPGQTAEENIEEFCKGIGATNG